MTEYILGGLTVIVAYLSYREYQRSRLEKIDFIFAPEVESTCDICTHKFCQVPVNGTVRCPKCQHEMSVVV